MEGLAKFFKSKPKKNNKSIKNKKNKGTLTCSQCGTNLMPGSGFCMECGAKIENKISDIPVLRCSDCNAVLQENSEFCMNCGRKFISESIGISYKTEKLELPVSNVNVEDEKSISDKKSIPETAVSVSEITSSDKKSIVSFKSDEKSDFNDKSLDCFLSSDVNNSVSNNLTINIKSFHNGKEISDGKSEMKNIPSKEIKGKFKYSSNFD